MGRTPLHLAVIKGYIKVIDLLVRSGSDINAQDQDQNTCMHIASMNGQVETVKYLLGRRNINLEIRNFEGKTPPEVAQNYETLQAFEQNIPSTKDLLAQNKDKYGRVAFHKVLIHNSRSDQVKKMLQAMQKPVAQHDINKIIQEKRDIREQKQKGEREKEKEKISQQKEQQQEKEEAKQQEQNTFSQEIETQGERLGPESFKVRAELGKGSFGEVFLVEKEDSGELFAMKILNKSKILGHNLVRYAMTERNVLSYSKHPFIVGLNYAFQTKDKLYLLLDYASGGDLGFQLSKEKRFPEWRARIYTSELLLAFEYLHSRDIIFRDLKPENVVLDEEGHAMLTDFGLSKEGVFQEKQARSFCGSVAYLAPEMLKRAGHGKSVDWYLLGVLLFEMLTGAPPYFTNNREQLFQNIEKSKLKIPGYCSQEAKSIMSQLLEKNPAKRLGTLKGAEELKQHSFFSGIDWEAVYKRELRPPAPHKKPLKTQKVNQDRIQGEPETGKTQLVGWSFAIPSKN